MLTLSELNALDEAGFTAALGHVFEHSPWVAQRTHREGPFPDFLTLHTLLCMTMRSASRDQQLELIRAHPDLAGRLAQQRQLTADSMREQASAGLDTMSDTEMGEFQKANDAYRKRFGFPFIICARLNDRASIIEAMNWRIRNTRSEELASALAEIEKIAWLRLKDLIRD